MRSESKPKPSLICFVKSNWLARLFVAGAIVAVCAMNGAMQGNAQSPAPDGTAELNDFDKAVQQRFHDVIGFGMARISSDRQFVPETAAEKEAAQALKRSGYQICLFLVGRGVLQQVPEQDRNMNKFGGSSHTIAGPVFLKKNQTMRGLPAAIELWEPAREAFKTFAGGGARYGFKVRNWNVEARPVRASDESCLRCHGVDTRVTYRADGSNLLEARTEANHLQVGDAIGMLLYVHKNKSDKP